MHSLSQPAFRLVPSRHLRVFWGERRLGIRLRSARGLIPRARLNLIPNLLSPQKTLKWRLGTSLKAGYEPLFEGFLNACCSQSPKQLLHSSLKLLKSTLSWIVAVVIATELKNFQLNFINCDDHIYIQVFVLPRFKSSSSFISI